MKKKVFFLTVLIAGIAIFGRKEYIQCYANVTEYSKIRNEVLQKQEEVNKLSAKTEQLLKNTEIPKLSLYENLDDLIASVDNITGSEIKQISALDICSDNTALYIATVENRDDVKKFTESINGVEVVVKVSNVKAFIERLSSVDCLFHRVSVDEAGKMVYIQILVL